MTTKETNDTKMVSFCEFTISMVCAYLHMFVTYLLLICYSKYIIIIKLQSYGKIKKEKITKWRAKSLS